MFDVEPNKDVHGRVQVGRSHGRLKREKWKDYGTFHCQDAKFRVTEAWLSEPQLQAHLHTHAHTHTH